MPIKRLGIMRTITKPTFQTNKSNTSEQKLRGGYYTPLSLATYLASWAIRTGDESILEPSCGDGNFIEALLQRFSTMSKSRKKRAAKIIAIEIEDQELQKAQHRAEQYPNASNQHIEYQWLCNDFFSAYSDLYRQEEFDVVIGNPPYIRFQYLNDASRNVAFEHLRYVGYKPTKLANAWVAFVQLSLELVKHGGRLAMVLPAELLQVKYAEELRERLTKQFEHIVMIGFKRLVFPEIQQEVVLLLADGKRSLGTATSDIHTLELQSGEELLALDDLNNAIAHLPTKHSRKGMKWTSLFLSESSFAALDQAEQHPELTPLGKLASVDVGIVTGRNSFFVVHTDKRKELNLNGHAIAILGRTGAIKSIRFSPDDFAEYQTQYPSYLLNLNGIDQEHFPKELQDYIALGEQEKIHEGYKCSIRKRWYDVPSIHVPDAFLYRQIHKFPLLVLNEASVTATDTIHRVRIQEGVNHKLLAASFFNSLTLAWAEVCGRSYGGGVLELEPREAEEIPIPYNEHLVLDYDKIDTLLRKNKEMEALEYVDSIVLYQFLGFDKQTIAAIRQAWIELRDRRITRR